MITITPNNSGISSRALRERAKAPLPPSFANSAALAYPDTRNSSASRQPFVASIGIATQSIVGSIFTCQPHGTKYMPM